MYLINTFYCSIYDQIGIPCRTIQGRYLWLRNNIVLEGSLYNSERSHAHRLTDPNYPLISSLTSTAAEFRKHDYVKMEVPSLRLSTYDDMIYKSHRIP